MIFKIVRRSIGRYIIQSDELANDK